MSEVLIRSVAELREAYLAALKAGKPDDAEIFRVALLERLAVLSARIGSNNRAKPTNDRAE